ncbi:MAG TPA: oxidoreductase, partial [Gammaproteobacteria bacterium]|nr:oxidoreductase [Gammaproteobacteria bacterium]
DGPHGHFVVPAGAHDGLAFIAGGVGFAPVMSILRQLGAERWPGPMCLVYGNRHEAKILYREELEAMAADMRLTVNLVLSEPPPGWQGLTGELTTRTLDACLSREQRERWTFFVCGPPPMMHSVEHDLLAGGVPGRRIIAERFKFD